MVVQQGGSSFEWYASTYDYRHEAVDAIKGHRKATYNAIGPFKIPAALAKAILADQGAECDLNEFIGDICAAATLGLAGNWTGKI